MSGTRATSGRAIAVRRTRSPIAVISARNAIQRAISSVGVAAVSEIDGITNCGAGPGFGPTANVNAPRTGWPSAEIARQKTRYQPSRISFSGTWSVSALSDERCGRPSTCCVPSASVTETIAKRGATASL